MHCYLHMKKSIASYQKSNRVRNLLLFSTIILFMFIVVVFLLSFQQYQNIQKRLESIYSSVNEETSDFTNILTKYNEAENHFRMFSVDFDKKHYIKYENTILDINRAIDSMLKACENNEKSSKSYSNNIERRRLLADDFVLLKLRITEILNFSDTLKNYPQLLANNSIPKAPLPTVEKTQEVREQPYVIVKKKSFFKRLFDNKTDTIKMQTAEPDQHDPQQLKHQYEKEIEAAEKSTRNQLLELKKDFYNLRQKERELLSTNFVLLYELNKIIRDVHDKQMLQKHAYTSDETKALFQKTSQFKWTLVSSMVFMFIMICFIAYYQLYSNYYERRLIEEKLYAKNIAEEKTDTLAEITHEIRTPINSLIGIIDLLKRKGDLYPTEDRLLLESAYSSIQSTSKTINDILNLSKVDGADSNLLLSDFEVNELLIDVIEQYRNQAELKNLSLRYVVEKGKNTVIHSDEFKIRHILNNLISNAIKYSQKGNITTTVKINEKTRQLILTVEDEGIGISEDLEKTIFRKYFTVNKTNKVEGGVGLGLFITRKLVSNLKGKINFTSQVGQGTTFKIEIPIPPAKKAKLPSVDRVRSIAELGKEISWLIVDDNALNLLYMKQFFSQHQFVETATNGTEALEIIMNKKIDVIITDINMPVMTGDELLMRIRKNPKYNHIFAIATSSDNEQVKSLELKHRQKFDGILIKPFNEKKLVDTILLTLKSRSEVD